MKLYDVDATPMNPMTGREETITKIARAFSKRAGETGNARIGRFVVGRCVDGWTTNLTFVDIFSGRTFNTTCSTDGPHNAAQEAYRWWSNDAWSLEL